MKSIYIPAVLTFMFGAISLPTLASTVEQTYQQRCAVCHGMGIAGAPKLTDKAQWTKRLAERGIEGLYKSAINGRNAMPPKGTCGDCSEAQLKQLVDFMVTEQK